MAGLISEVDFSEAIEKDVLESLGIRRRMYQILDIAIDCQLGGDSHIFDPDGFVVIKFDLGRDFKPHCDGNTVLDHLNECIPMLDCDIRRRVVDGSGWVACAKIPAKEMWSRLAARTLA